MCQSPTDIHPGNSGAARTFSVWLSCSPCPPLLFVGPLLLKEEEKGRHSSCWGYMSLVEGRERQPNTVASPLCPSLIDSSCRWIRQRFCSREGAGAPMPGTQAGFPMWVTETQFLEATAAVPRVWQQQAGVRSRARTQIQAPWYGMRASQAVLHKDILPALPNHMMCLITWHVSF